MFPNPHFPSKKYYQKKGGKVEGDVQMSQRPLRVAHVQLETPKRQSVVAKSPRSLGSQEWT